MAGHDPPPLGNESKGLLTPQDEEGWAGHPLLEREALGMEVPERQALG